MSDAHPGSGRPEHGDGELDDLLREALAHEEQAELDELVADLLRADAALDDTPLSAELAARALAAPALANAEALLADALEGESEALWVEHALDTGPVAVPATPLREGLRRAALAAFERAALPAVPVAGLTPHPADAGRMTAGRKTAGRKTAGRKTAGRDVPLRARRLAPLLRLRGAAVAAAAVLVLGLGLFLTGGENAAHAGLQLRALARADTAGSVQTSRVQPRYFAPLGETFTPGRDELLRFSLAEDAMVVVGPGDAVRVSRAALARDGVGAQDAVLRLESGEAQLATRAHPVPLLIDGIGLLVLVEGAAHVAVDVGDGTHAPAVALHEGSRARFHRADGSGSVPLVGPTRVLLAREGVKAYGAPARALFHDLRFFGGPLPAATHRRPVSARLFRASRAPDAPGRTRRGRQDLRLLASRDAPDATHASTLLHWRPETAVRAARALEVMLRAPTGTRVTLLQEGLAQDAAAPTAVVVHAGAGREPGVATVSLSLPEGWFDRLPQGRLTLRLDAPLPTVDAPRVVAWFDGVALVFGPASAGAQAQGVRKAARDG